MQNSHIMVGFTLAASSFVVAIVVIFFVVVLVVLVLLLRVDSASRVVEGRLRRVRGQYGSLADIAAHSRLRLRLMRCRRRATRCGKLLICFDLYARLSTFEDITRGLKNKT